MDGLIHGIRREYYKNRVIFSELPYVNGLAHGINRNYDENGVLTSEMPYTEGHMGYYFMEW